MITEEELSAWLEEPVRPAEAYKINKLIAEVKRLRDDNKNMRQVLFEAREIDKILDSPYIDSIQKDSPCHRLLKLALKAAEGIEHGDN
jgi:hypothetical protein